MSKKGFRQPRKKDQKAVEQFADGADMRSNNQTSDQESSNKEGGGKEASQQAFYTTLQPQFKEIIQAIAYYERISQREVVEQALDVYYKDKQQKLKQALEVYRKQAE